MTAPVAQDRGANSVAQGFSPAYSAKTEVIAGITTFVTMAYIIFVQPAVLSSTSRDADRTRLRRWLLAPRGVGRRRSEWFGEYPSRSAPAWARTSSFFPSSWRWRPQSSQNPGGVARHRRISGVIFLVLSGWVARAVLDSISPSMRNASGWHRSLRRFIVAKRRAIVAHPGRL